MTFIGKIFVVVITAFSLIMLGISTVALTTATDWKAEIKKLDTEKGRLQPLLTAAQASENDAKSRYETAKKEHAGAINPVVAKIAGLEGDIKKAQDDTAVARDELTKKQSATKASLEEVKTRTDEIVKLREQDAALKTQRGKFEGRQSELNAELVNVKRMVQAAETNAAQIGQSR
jgi:chromosome segregation ATPase